MNPIRDSAEEDGIDLNSYVAVFAALLGPEDIDALRKCSSGLKILSVFYRHEEWQIVAEHPLADGPVYGFGNDASSAVDDLVKHVKLLEDFASAP